MSYWNALARDRTESQDHQVQLAHTSQASDSNSDRNLLQRWRTEGGNGTQAQPHESQDQSLERQNAPSQSVEGRIRHRTPHCSG